jgi:hypothetical protein
MRRTVPLLCGLVLMLAACSPAGGHRDESAAGLDGAASGPDATASAAAPARAGQVAASTPVESPVSYPERGAGTWRHAAGTSKKVGDTGQLMRYRVAVERGITGITPREFAGRIEVILGDRRGWAADGRWRFQRVAADQWADFTIYLATPATRDRLCGGGYDRYTSCRIDERVVINVARWTHGASTYGDDLTNYRRYVINHETGHALGFGHELCTGRGDPAPIMQQQTLGLHGCVPNPWHLVSGEPHHGVSGVYDDPVPRA